MKKITVSSPKRLCIEDGRYTYQYAYKTFLISLAITISSCIVEQNVIFLALCSSSFPKTLAFQFLEELSREFLRTHTAEVDAAIRPYACVSFDIEIEKIRRAYIDKRQKNKLDELNEELVDVKGILSKNLEDVIGRGEKIDGMMFLFPFIIPHSNYLTFSNTNSCSSCYPNVWRSSS